MPRSGAPRILLVEDSEMDIRLVEEALRESDVRIALDVVRNGRDAVAYLQGQPPFEDRPTPQLVLLDLNLPGLGGIEVLQKLKQDCHLRRIPVCVLSTSSQKSDVRACYDAQANCYLTKSSDFSAFQKTLSRARDFWLGEAQLPFMENRYGQHA